jgi:acetyl esterase/lipase
LHIVRSALQLWPDELDAMREEARRTVDGGSPFLQGFGGTKEELARLGRDERIRLQREQMTIEGVTVPEAVERELAGVRCRVILPDDRPRAVYLHFHGGGMVSGSPDMMDIPNLEMARTHGLAVVSVDYRKAPEHPWPAGPDDGLAVARWLVEHGESELGAAPMLIGGESAGGYMTAITALRVRDELGAIDRVIGCNIVFPVLDWSGSPSQLGRRPHDGFDVLDPEGIEFCAECFLPGRSPAERRAPEISPAYGDLRGLPPCLVSVGTCDHLVDDSLLFAQRAAAAGVDVELVVLPEMPHAFMVFDCGMTKWWAARTHEWFEARLARCACCGSTCAHRRSAPGAALNVSARCGRTRARRRRTGPVAPSPRNGRRGACRPSG